MKKTRNHKRVIKNICFTAIFAALCTAATLISVPIPIGYVNAGDLMVLTAAWCLGGGYGAMAAGIGSRFGGGIKQLEPVGPSGEIIMDYSIYDAMEAGFDKVVFVIKEENLSCISVVDTAELLSTSDRPVHRVGIYTELAFKLIKKIKRISCLTVQLVDESKDRNISHRADLEELSGLRLDTLCRINNHYSAVSRHKGTVGILREILVAGCIKNVYAVAVVLKLKNGRCDRDTSLLLDVHPVGDGMLVRLLTFYRAGRLYCAAVKKELLSESGLTCVRV